MRTDCLLARLHGNLKVGGGAGLVKSATLSSFECLSLADVEQQFTV